MLSKLLATSLLAASILTAPALADFIAPKFDISLKTPPKDRYDVAIRSQINLHGWEYTYAPLLAYFEGTLGHEFYVKYDEQLTSILEAYPQEYKEELLGAYDTLIELGFGQNITMGELVVLQLYYELNPFCTATLVNDPETGGILHGRNMDYSLPGLSNITVTFTFLDEVSNKPIFQSTSFLGYGGVVTGMRIDGWTVQANQRFKKEIPFVHSIIAALKGYRSIGFTLRDALMAENSYAGAIEWLKGQKLIAPIYIILGGLKAGEAVVITGDRDGVDESDESNHGLAFMGDEDYDWFLVQTNYEPATHNGDGRKEFVEGELSKVDCGDVTMDKIMEIMSTPPDLTTGTVYTTLMSAAVGTFEATVRTQDAENEGVGAAGSGVSVSWPREFEQEVESRLSART